jgi:hypothetical protein
MNAIGGHFLRRMSPKLSVCEAIVRLFMAQKIKKEIPRPATAGPLGLARQRKQIACQDGRGDERLRLTAKSTICQSLCHRTFHFACSEFCKKPCIIQQNIAGCGTSRLNCGERRMRFISRLATPALALTSLRQRRAEGLASSAWRSVLRS